MNIDLIDLYVPTFTVQDAIDAYDLAMLQVVEGSKVEWFLMDYYTSKDIDIILAIVAATV